MFTNNIITITTVLYLHVFTLVHLSLAFIGTILEIKLKIYQIRFGLNKFVIHPLRLSEISKM